jgi:ParB-like nuclease family protein
MIAKTKGAKKKATPAKAGPDGLRITGKVVLAPLASVQPNTWNPNRMTEFQVESTREGLKENGWLAAYSLLVWGTDEKGIKRNLIIDGEHRWRIARDLGFVEGPMVFLDGVTAKRAKEMTIEFDAKRGRFDDVALRDLIADIGVDDGLAFRLGIDDETFKELMNPRMVLPPGDFSEVSIDAQTDYTCPKCAYQWSGQSGSTKTSKAAAAAAE